MIKVAAIGECMVEMQQLPDGLYRRAWAGDTFNMAQYLAWLGEDSDIRVSYVTVLGKDKFGTEMLTAWEKNGLDTSLIMQSPVKNTGLYFADLDEKGNRDYTFYRSDSAAKKLFHQPDSARVFDVLLEYDMIYASAISLMILSEEDRQHLIDFFALARSKGIKTAFDTNYRKSGWSSAEEAAHWMNKMMKHIDIVLPTNDENQEVFGDKNSQETLDRLKALDVKEIVIKRGDKNCYIWHEEQHIKVPAVQGVKVVDTTSAGDSFNAGYLYGRLTGLAPEESAKIGHRIAAEVVQHRGAIIPKEKVPKAA